MSKDSQNTKKLVNKIKSIIINFNSILESIDSRYDSEINDDLWRIRAEIEYLCVELKELINNEKAVLRLQKSISTSIKGTSKREKAISKLKQLKINSVQVNIPNIKNEKIVFKQLWELKETISAVLGAFPQRKFIWINGELKEEDEDIFVI